MAMMRLAGMKSTCERKGLVVADMEFYGVPLAQYSREDLEIMIAYQIMRQNENLGADVQYAGKKRGAEKSA